MRYSTQEITTCGQSIFVLISTKRRNKMQKHGLFVNLKAQMGKSKELASLLKGAVALANEEAGTKQWYAFQIGEDNFGIFDTFDNDQARQAHLSGKIAAALMANAPQLVEGKLNIESFDILAQK
jgi:quinol monooxygenase YgiN